MKLQLMEIAASVLAAILIMIFHEVPKSAVFIFRRRREEEEEKKKWKWSSVFFLQRYIDPIGLILCVTTYGGFSKPYMFRIRDRKTNRILGVVGFFDLFCILAVSMYMLHWQYQIVDWNGINLIYDNDWRNFGKLFWIYMGILSIGVIIVNLFPVSVFDMGLLIAANSPRAYLNMVQKDSVVKIIVLGAMALGVTTHITMMVFEFMISVLGYL